MPEMIAKVAHWYGGRDRSPGDRFHVEPKHVHIERALGRAEVAEEFEDTYRTAHIEASSKKKRFRVKA